MEREKALTDTNYHTVWMEYGRYMALLSVIQKSATDVLAVLDGRLIMNREIEAMLDSMRSGCVPELWKHVSYLSVRTLASYVADLRARLEFLNSWIIEGPPSLFWLPGVFSPRSFLTGLRLAFARKRRVLVSGVGLEYRFPLPSAAAKDSGLQGGTYVRGLWCEGFSYDAQLQQMKDPPLGQYFTPLDAMLILPVAGAAKPAAEMAYDCPIYCVQSRSGVSALGEPNLITNVMVPSGRPGVDWLKRGAVLLLQHDA